jgi:DNA polymerase III subunit delta
MPLTPDTLAAALKRPLPALAVVAGEEALLVMEAADAVRAAAKAQGFEEREIFEVDSKSGGWSDALGAANALSLFVQRRVIEVRVNGGLGVEGAKAVTDWLANPPPDCLLLVLLGALDARARKASWFTAVERDALLVYAWPVRPEGFHDWVMKRANSVGVKLTAEACDVLVERTEGNLLACAQDLQKLRLLVPDGTPIDATTLTEAVADNARFGVFDLADRLLLGDADGSVRSLQRLREEGTAVQEVLGGLLWVLRQWAKAAQAYGRTRDAAAACDQAGVRRAQQAAYCSAITRSGPIQPLGWLRWALRIDAGSKSTGGEPTAWADLLTLVLAASGAAPLRNQRRT